MKQILLLVMAVVLVGCQSMRMEKKWEPRVGSFTYSQVIAELGPPDAKEIDGGSTIAAWRWTKTRTSNFTNFSTGQNNVFVRSDQQQLMLTFGPDKVLRAWEFNKRWKAD